jgi:hypothetical protein
MSWDVALGVSVSSKIFIRRQMEGTERKRSKREALEKPRKFLS